MILLWLLKICNSLKVSKNSKDLHIHFCSLSLDTPSSFRPISKFNVILKGLEKLVKWELERTSLTENPLSRNQHAYSRVYNTDTALAKVVDEAEKGILRNQFTFRVVIDITGAFNNLKTEYKEE